jgi:hypothetical protein
MLLYLKLPTAKTLQHIYSVKTDSKRAPCIVRYMPQIPAIIECFLPSLLSALDNVLEVYDSEV